MSGKKCRRVPLWVVDRIDDVAEAAERLSQSVKCVCVAVRSPEEDTEEYIGGTLSVLLMAAEGVARMASELSDEVEGAMA